MKTSRILLLPVAFALLTVGTRADDTSHRLAVGELLKVTRAEQLLQQSAAEIEDLEKSLLLKLARGRDLESARGIADQIRKATNEVVMGKLSWAAMEPVYTGLYMKVFTEEEVRAMTEFYKSPLGQKVLEKTPGLMADIMQATSLRVEALKPEIEAAARKAAGVEATPSEAATEPSTAPST